MAFDTNFTGLLSLDYGESSGSGFKITLNNQVYLVTAKHVLYNPENKLRCKSVVMTSQKVWGNEVESRIIEIDMEKACVFSSEKEDIAVVLLESNHTVANYVNVVQEGSLSTLNFELNNVESIYELKIASDVLLVGFPTSLIYQETKYFDVSTPLLRKGIIAGFNQSDNTFIIDCPSYYGNSGGPVIFIDADNSTNIIGLVSRYIPFMITWRNNREFSISHTEFSNSGYTVCVPIKSVTDLIDANLI